MMSPNDPFLRAKLNKAFVTSGAQERIYGLLQSRLDESMWSENLVKIITENIKDIKSMDFQQLAHLVQADGHS
ncbi:Transcription and mRNA export factor ENY2 [Neolecta irregularis DAH-3]|uniref:Transcription and mRNA export factor ENY2 n=1 Tax=Neolecta irregularis (strain DAH-3) TaxID=1198029 RepID=A0A1U7LT62_NEOID|nr:Transcription and mRNA export factor ENY2 [Neolecta irregularis DAH-3]|eukprot:OLL25732.1 Transcription and mRNA export factor ENY2 [Neolecta irregularis DAH-3]